MNKILSKFLIIVAFAWLGWIVAKDYKTILDIFSNLRFQNILWLIFSLMLGGLAVSCNIFIFKEVLFRNSGISLPFRYLSNIFFASQVVRYLPGRFFGVAYQMNETREKIPPIKMLKSSIEYTLFCLVFNIMAAGAMLIYLKFNITIALLTFLLGISLIVIYFKINGTDQIISLIGRIAPGKRKILVNKTLAKIPFTIESIIYIFSIYIFSWILYLGSWFSLKYVFPELQNISMVLLCATYTVSWAVGFIAMITPGGLGIREMFFVFLLSESITSAFLAFLSIFLRFWLILIDCLLFFINQIVYRSLQIKRNRYLDKDDTATFR